MLSCGVDIHADAIQSKDPDDLRPGKIGMVTIAAKMQLNNLLQSSGLRYSEQFVEKSCCLSIGKMPLVTQDPSN